MNYKAYPNSTNTPARLTRKGARRIVFLFNKAATKARKKAARLERKSLAEGE